MPNFKVIVSKWTQKFTFIRNNSDETSLKEDLHSEWFSILSIEKMDDIVVSWNKYYFEIIKDWQTKPWTISSNDIFKAFLKIKYQLWYNLKYIYQDENTSLEEKEKIIHDLEEQYEIYQKANSKEIIKEQVLEKEKVRKVEEESTDTFQMKKELEETYKVIDRVLAKIKFFIDLENSEFINFEKRAKLKEIYNELIKVKSSTNIFKLRQIWELWLVKIWEIEMSIIETKKNDEVKNLLKETNKLLKQVWSKKAFIEKEKDLWYIFSNFFTKIKENIELDRELNKRQELDKKSTNYLKTKSLILKYSQKLKEINKEMLKNFLIFLVPTKQNIEKKEYLVLKKKVIRQNLSLLEAKLSWSFFSYVKIVKWYNYFVWKIIEFFDMLKLPMFFIIVFYTVLFLFFNLLSSIWVFYLDMNFRWLFYFILVLFFYIFINFSKWLFSLIFSVVFFSFIFIFWVINF